jgi:hypothetical protein
MASLAGAMELPGRCNRGAEPGTERSPEPDHAGVSELDLQVGAHVGINDRHRQEGGGRRGRVR